MRPPSPLLLAIPLAVLLVPPGTTTAGQICKQDDVVDFVAREIRRQAAYVRVERDQIVERPAPDPDAVLCLIGTVRQEYDYTRFREMRWAETREYQVRKLQHGYEVTLVGSPGLRP